MPTIEFTDRTALARAQAGTSALARAAEAATRAPSVFNTQPWRWRIAGNVAELRADRARQLDTADPDGRLLTVSCGAALHHARTALAGAGVVAAVTRLPEPADPDQLARLRVTASAVPGPDVVRRQRAMALRHTDRRPFADVPVAEEALRELRAAAEAEGAHLHLLRPSEVPALAVAAARAAATEFADPAYRAELAAWTRASNSGLGSMPGPRRVPVRAFGADATATPADGEVLDGCARYALLFTDADTPAAWLAAGEALSALLLTAAMARLAVSPMSDVVEVPVARLLLRDLLGGIGHPMLALRIGAPADGTPAPASRRPVDDVVEIER
jgi:nitroreductase